VRRFSPEIVTCAGTISAWMAEVSVYSQLRRGLIDSFQNIDALYIVPLSDPDEKAFDSTYAAAMQPDRIERLSRRLALSGQSLDIIVEADFVDNIACGARRWRATMQPKIWHKDAWRPWGAGRIDRDANWLLSNHPELRALDDERQLLGLLAAYELMQYFGSGKTVPLSRDHAVRIVGNLIEQFQKFTWRIRDANPLPPPLALAINQLDRNDPAQMEATLKDVVVFFRTIPFPATTTDCPNLAQREQTTALSGVSRQ
jgi:hypothetical protein